MEVQTLCFKAFPNECSGCPDYREIRQDATEQLVWMSGIGFGYPQPPIKVIKECKAFHKRIVEFQR